MEPKHPKLKGYTILEKIGKGGQGSVYKVKNRKGRLFAVKVFDENGEDTLVEREVYALMQLNHQNIIRVYDTSVKKGNAFILMEYMKHGDIQHYIQKYQVSLKDKLYFIHDIALALQCLHRNGFVHRDVKPSNIFIGEQNNVKYATLGDFGISKEAKSTTETDFLRGTVEYMPLEVLIGNKKLTQKTDLYALGMTLYKVVSGNLPYKFSNNFQIVENLKKISKYIEGASEELDALCIRSIANNEKTRYQTIEEFIHDLNNILDIESANEKEINGFGPSRGGASAVAKSSEKSLISIKRNDTKKEKNKSGILWNQKSMIQDTRVISNMERLLKKNRYANLELKYRYTLQVVPDVHISNLYDNDMVLRREERVEILGTEGNFFEIYNFEEQRSFQTFKLKAGYLYLVGACYADGIKCAYVNGEKIVIEHLEDKDSMKFIAEPVLYSYTLDIYGRDREKNCFSDQYIGYFEENGALSICEYNNNIYHIINPKLNIINRTKRIITNAGLSFTQNYIWYQHNSVGVKYSNPLGAKTVHHSFISCISYTDSIVFGTIQDKYAYWWDFMASSIERKTYTHLEIIGSNYDNDIVYVLDGREGVLLILQGTKEGIKKKKKVPFDYIQQYHERLPFGRCYRWDGNEYVLYNGREEDGEKLIIHNIKNNISEEIRINENYKNVQIHNNSNGDILFEYNTNDKNMIEVYKIK